MTVSRHIGKLTCVVRRRVVPCSLMTLTRNRRGSANTVSVLSMIRVRKSL